MPKGRKLLFAALAASMWPAAFALPAVPAEAIPPNGGACLYDPGLRMWYREYVITGYEPCTPSPSEWTGVCVYDEESGTWVRNYVFGQFYCDPPV
jgi:hypothetical protein